MALTILQEPTSPNVSSTNLIYTISSSDIPQFQFRYLADLYESGSSTRLARFKYPQNSSGTVNIDMGRPIGDYLDTNYNWKINTLESSSISCKRFTIEFGEEYASSYIGNVTEFPSLVSSSITVLNGNIQYPSVDSYTQSPKYGPNQAASSINFDSSCYAVENAADPVSTYPLAFSDKKLTNNPNVLQMPATSKYYTDGTYTYNAGSNSSIRMSTAYANHTKGWMTTQPLGLEDYHTEHFLYVPTNLEPTGSNNIFRFQTILSDGNVTIWRSGTQSITVNKDNPTIVSLPIGFANELVSNAAPYTGTKMNDIISSSAQWNHLGLYMDPSNYGSMYPWFNYYYNEDKGPDVLLNTNLSFQIKPSMWATGKYYPTNCKGEKTRFAFINSFGVWDYYNVYMPTRKVTKVDRKIYEQPRLNLEERITTYNVSNRGEKQYYTEYTDEFEITTDIIDDKESQWLKEMFESTEVFIQSGSNFIPINILNNSETIINSKARNKNYQYTIRYQFSNLREPR